jgi:hypothetical protein
MRNCSRERRSSGVSPCTRSDKSDAGMRRRGLCLPRRQQHRQRIRTTLFGMYIGPLVQGQAAQGVNLRVRTMSSVDTAGRCYASTISAEAAVDPGLPGGLDVADVTLCRRASSATAPLAIAASHWRVLLCTVLAAAGWTAAVLALRLNDPTWRRWLLQLLRGML